MIDLEQCQQVGDGGQTDEARPEPESGRTLAEICLECKASSDFQKRCQSQDCDLRHSLPSEAAMGNEPDTTP